MNDTTIFIFGLGVFGVALIGAMWSVIPAQPETGGEDRRESIRDSGQDLDS